MIVLAISLMAIVLVFRLAVRDGPAAGGLLVGLLVASSPYALLHATEVVSEFPYLACSLAAILIMTGTSNRPSRRTLLAAAALLAFLPFLRTIGLALILATLAWCVLDGRKRAFWPAPVVALGVTALWLLRNNLAKGPTYFGAIAADLKRLGASGFAAKSMDSAWFYGSRFVDVLLPGVWPGRPLYERMTIGGTPDLGGLFGGGLVVGFAIVALAAWGLWTRRKLDGTLIALYAAAFLAVLAVYPPRHERLTWPLIPIVWAMIPAGLAGIGKHASAMRRAGTGLAVLLIAWQGCASAAMVRDNLAWARLGERFYAERVPPIYFADWRRAGTWLREHAVPSAHVLTRHSDVGFTSGMLQDSIRFEELSPQAWRARIAKFHARYLVVPASLYGKFFPFELLAADPAYSYAVAFKEADVAVIEVSPNRTGRVEPAPAAVRGLDAPCEQAAEREPWRVDLATRCAELAASAGGRDEAIARLSSLVGRGGADVRVQIALGQLLLDAGRLEEAGVAFRAASGLPEAELLTQTIERGRAAVERRASANRSEGLAEARALMEALRWSEAKTVLDNEMAAAPEDPAVLMAVGELRFRLGAYDDAIASYRRAAERGAPRAATQAAGLADALAIEAAVTTASPETIVRAASFWAANGAPGKALDLMERALAHHPGEPELSGRVVEIHRFFGLD
jgi:tetratricopeptide (TPR) repeat protein